MLLYYRVKRRQNTLGKKEENGPFCRRHDTVMQSFLRPGEPSERRERVHVEQ